MSRRLDPWKGKHLSSGGKLILTNACLSSLPIYTMGFYLLPKSSHSGMDSVRGRFFWQGAKEEFKYHMAKWDTLSRPIDQGGLGIINTHIMNECLLVKWIWRIAMGATISGISFWKRNTCLMETSSTPDAKVPHSSGKDFTK